MTTHRLVAWAIVLWSAVCLVLFLGTFASTPASTGRELQHLTASAGLAMLLWVIGAAPTLLIWARTGHQKPDAR